MRPAQPDGETASWVQVWLEAGREGQVFTYANPERLRLGVGDLVQLRLRGRRHIGLVVELLDALPEELRQRTVLPIEAVHQSAAVDGQWQELITAVADACRGLGLPLLPGVATASEVMQAQAEGHDFLKFFPATAAGGVPMLKALGGPFPEVRFCPTGGITARSAPEFLALDNVPVCGGSWLTPSDAVEAGDWSRITQLARQACALRGG